MVCSCVWNVLFRLSTIKCFRSGNTVSKHLNAPLTWPDLCLCVARRTNFTTASSPQPSGLIIPPRTGDAHPNAPQNLNYIRTLSSWTVRRYVLSLQQNVCLHFKDRDSEKQSGWVSWLTFCPVMPMLDFFFKWLKTVMPCFIFTSDLKTTTSTMSPST